MGLEQDAQRAHRRRLQSEERVEKKRILILCTGNSCRSQMAEGFLKRFAPTAQIFSAGTEPAPAVHPKAILVMRERNIDLADNLPKGVEQFLPDQFDYVITVCDGAKELCPVFTGRVAHRLHMGFEDPARVIGSEEFVMNEFRRIRDEIERSFHEFAERNLR